MSLVRRLQLMARRQRRRGRRYQPRFALSQIAVTSIGAWGFSRWVAGAATYPRHWL